MNKDGLRIYIKRCGSQVKAAALLEGITPTRFNNWLNLPACHMRKTHAEQIEAVTQGEISCLALLHYLNKEDQKAVLKESKTGQKILKVPASALVLPADRVISAAHRAYAEHCLSRLAKPPVIVIDMNHQVLASHALLALMQERGEEMVHVRMLDINEIIQEKYEPYALAHILQITQRIAVIEAVQTQLGLRQGQRSDKALRLKSDEVNRGKSAEIHPHLIQLRQNFDEVQEDNAQDFLLKGRTDEFVAQRFGFGNRQTFHQAKFIYHFANAELLAAVDTGKIKIFKAYQQVKAEMAALQSMTSQQEDSL